MSMWFTSDTHFGHENILTFKDGEGMHIRQGFASADEMDARMIENWNSVVKPGDKVYHLGDVVVGKERPNVGQLMAKLAGSKRLIVGNHDDIPEMVRSGAFKKVQLWRMFKYFGFTLSHIPLPLDQFRYKVPLNVHGHIHEKPDPSINHFNICVEKTGYRPIHLDEILAEKNRRGL